MSDRTDWNALLSALNVDSDQTSAWEIAYGRLRAYARTVIRDLYKGQIQRGQEQELVDDLVHDVLLKFNSEGVTRRLAEADSPKDYLVRMVRNASIDASRRKETEKRAYKRVAAERMDAVTAHRTSDERTLNELDTVLILLSNEERNLIRMKFHEDLSLRQMSEIIGISYGAVAGRIFRLNKKIRRLLDE